MMHTEHRRHFLNEALGKNFLIIPDFGEALCFAATREPGINYLQDF